jgi:thymidylate kinase
MSEKSIEQPVTIAFDGLHRAGKGTQASYLVEVLNSNGLETLVVRGDGTRDGLGLSLGDPFSLEWQQRNRYMKSEIGGRVEDWNASSLILLQELSVILDRGHENKLDAVIIDRTILSRAAFLLHRGVGMIGERMTLDELYPNNQTLQVDGRLDLKALVPDVIFDLRAQNPAYLLDRLDHNDPKYVFRSRNIKGGFESSMNAKRHVPENVEVRVKMLDAAETPDEVHDKVLAHLAKSAFGALLKL